MQNKMILRGGFSKSKSPVMPTSFEKMANLYVNRPLCFLEVLRKLEISVLFYFGVSFEQLNNRNCLRDGVCHCNTVLPEGLCHRLPE